MSNGRASNVDYLSLEDVATFERDGFIVLRHVVPEGDLEILRRESTRVMRRRTMKKREQKGGGTFDSFRNCLALSDSYLPLLTHRSVLGAVVTLMGTNLRLTTSQVVFRHPDPTDRPLAVRVAKWHRDMAPATDDLGHDRVPLLQIKCMFFLTDCSTPGRGSSLVVPGSNRLPSGPTIEEGQLDPPNAVELAMGAGDCLLFENRTWHAGGPNYSTDVRKAVILGYAFRWIGSHDFRVVPPRLRERASEVELFLLGESPPGPPGFRVGGWRNPLQEWIDQDTRSSSSGDLGRP